MKNLTLAACGVALAAAGFGAGWLMRSDSNPSSAQKTAAPTAERAVVPFEYQAPAPKISISEAVDHRESHYEELASVNDVLDLPTDFSQTEALYTLAGRASETELHDLITQATQIIDRYDRTAALNILFARYTELDPHAALSHLQSMNLDTDDLVLEAIFSNWARNDLTSALAAANQIANVAQRKKAGHTILTQAARHNFGNLDAIAAQLSDRHDTTWMEAEAIGLRANYDAQAALFEALSLNGQNGQWSAVRRVGTVWARNDPHGALAAADAISNTRLKEQYLSSLYRQWVSDDPDAAVQHVLAMADESQRNRHLQSLLHSYAAHAPEDALAMALQLSGDNKSQIFNQLFTTWAHQDPDAAIAAFEQLPPGSINRQIVSSLARELGRVDTDKALAFTATLDGQIRQQAEQQILVQAAHSDPQRALNAVLANPDASSRQKQLSMVLSQLSHSNPELALMYLNELPAGQQRESLIRNIATRWATTDYNAASSWLSTLTGAEYTAAATGVAQQIAARDPQRAASLVRALPPGSRAGVLRTISSTLSERTPQEALSWLNQFSSEPGYEQAVSQLVQKIVHSDPQYAMTIANQLSTDHRQNAVNSAMQIWAEVDPREAARWAARSDEDVRGQATRAVAAAWARSDSDSALRWARTLRSDDARDNAFAGLAHQASTDLSTAVEIVTSISDDRQRERSIMAAYMRLYQSTGDRLIANQFLDRIGASDDIRYNLEAFGKQ